MQTLTNDVRLIHPPTWQLDGDEWHMIVGNRSVAKIVPNECAMFPRVHWLSVIESHEYPDHGWHAVDFETLETAKYGLEQWWEHMCRGEEFDPNREEEEEEGG